MFVKDGMKTDKPGDGMYSGKPGDGTYSDKPGDGMYSDKPGDGYTYKGGRRSRKKLMTFLKFIL